MAIANVQNAALASTSSALSQQTGAFGANPTVGNYLIAGAWGWNNTASGGVTSVTFTDTAGGNTWTAPAGVFKTVTNDLWLSCGYAKVAASAGTFKITATPNGTSISSGAVMVAGAEFSGVPASSPQDGTASGTAPGTVAASFAPGNMTVASGSLVVAVVVNDDGGNPSTLSTPAGWTSLGKQTNGTFEVGEVVYRINPASPSNPTWSTTDGSFKWGAAQFALLADVGAAYLPYDLPHSPQHQAILAA